MTGVVERGVCDGIVACELSVVASSLKSLIISSFLEIVLKAAK